MLKRPKKQTDLDRRILDVDEELRSLRRSLKGLERGTARSLPMQPAPTAPARPRPPSPGPVVAPPSEVTAVPIVAAAPLPPGAAPSDDLYARAARARIPAAPGEWRRKGPAAAPITPAQDEALEDKHRFARYYSSGNFIAQRPLRQERRFQRNRAIAMIVVVAGFAYVLFSILYR